MSSCLYCYQRLLKGEVDFHPACAKKIFGITQPPAINFNLKQLEALAEQIITQSKAVTGVQAKLSLNLEKRKNELPRLTVVGLHGDFILKPPTATYKQLPENEDLTMHLAELINIQTAQHTLIRLQSGELAYLTKRFDRQKGNKIAVEDFCQLTENLTEHKYRGSVEMIGRVANKHTINKGYEAQRLFELVLFSYLTGNADMHLKNFSLIENDLGEFEFSPAYDLLSTALVMPEDKEEFALTINGKKSKITKRDFDALGLALNINEKSLQAIYKRFNDVLPEWFAFVKQSFLSKTLQQDYTALITQKHSKIFN